MRTVAICLTRPGRYLFGNDKQPWHRKAGHVVADMDYVTATYLISRGYAEPHRGPITMEAEYIDPRRNAEQFHLRKKRSEDELLRIAMEEEL